MRRRFEKSWFPLDGRLREIAFQGDSHVRFPEELATVVLGAFSREGDWVLDPFAGFGTTLHVAQQMGRNAIGFEVDGSRARFANQGLEMPNRVIHGSAEGIGAIDPPEFDLVFTSPPYVTVHLQDDPWGECYFEDMLHIFKTIQAHVKTDATVVIEVSNIRTDDGFRPLAWQWGELLSQIFTLQREIIRCNTSDAEAGPGFDHSYLLVFAASRGVVRSRG